MEETKINVWSNMDYATTSKQMVVFSSNNPVFIYKKCMIILHLVA